MRLLRMLVFIGIFWVMSAIVFAQIEGASLDERGYGLYVPSTYDENGDDELPLIIALHGFGDTWQNFYPATGLASIAERENFIVAFPQGYLNQWNDGGIGDHYEDDVQIFRDLIARVERDYRVNDERIYLVGFSNGGTMVFHAACQDTDLFDGIAAVAGTMRSGDYLECGDDVQLPVLIIHGTADTVVPFDGSESRVPASLAPLLWAEQNGCDTSTVPEYTDALFQNGNAIYFYDNCPNGNIVMLNALQGVAHIWPGFGAYMRGQTPTPPYTDTARFIWGFFELSYQARLTAEANPEMTPEATAEATQAADE